MKKFFKLIILSSFITIFFSQVCHASSYRGISYPLIGGIELSAQEYIERVKSPVYEYVKKHAKKLPVYKGTLRLNHDEAIKYVNEQRKNLNEFLDANLGMGYRVSHWAYVTEFAASVGSCLRSIENLNNNSQNGVRVTFLDGGICWGVFYPNQ